jgi:hypothetical protein
LGEWREGALIDLCDRINAAHRRRGRLPADLDGVEICRVDVARSSVPVSATMSDREPAFWVRMNNTTRRLPEAETDSYVRDHWG